MKKIPSRFLLDEVRRRWLAQPPVRRRRAHVQAFGDALRGEGTLLGTDPAMHLETLLKIVRPLIEPG